MPQKVSPYVPADDPVLHTPSKQLAFPLTPEDLKDISILEGYFDAEKNCSGLAAPQVGIGKAIIVFAVPDYPELKKWRKDLTDTMDKTIWINPTFQTVGTDIMEDWEGCFSVPDMACFVPRHTNIAYNAFDVNGTPITGSAHGFLARVIQHEIDHINGILFTSKSTKTIPKDEYIAMRKKAMA